MLTEDHPRQILITKLKRQTRELFTHVSLAVDVEQRVLQLWQAGAPKDQAIDDFLALQLPRAIEDCFAALRNDCLDYCRQLLICPDKADDLIQEALLRLIRSSRPIQYLRAWLRKVIYHLLVDEHNHDKAQMELLRRLESEYESLSSLISLPGELDQTGEIGILLPEMLDHPDFLALQEMRNYPNLRVYAEAKSLSYERAKQLSKEYKRNLKAACLRLLGWQTTTDILDYKEYKSLQRYVRNLVRCGIKASPDNCRKNSYQTYSIELAEIFQGFENLHEWNVTLIGDSCYRLSIIGSGAAKHPVVISAVVTIKNNHRIRTESINRLKLAGVLEVPPEARLPVDKGQLLLSKQQIEDMLRPLK